MVYLISRLAGVCHLCEKACFKKKLDTDYRFILGLRDAVLHRDQFLFFAYILGCVFRFGP